MTLFLVSYDLSEPGQKYDCIKEKLKPFATYHAQQSVWIVDFKGTAEGLVDLLLPCLDSNDRLFVGELADDWCGYNMPKGAEWLKRHL